MSTLSDNERTFVLELLNEASKLLRSLWPGNEEADALAVERKADGSPVTNADKAADRLITSGLTNRFPEIPVFSEEQEPPASLSQAEKVWVLDPLDGTYRFIQGERDFGILLALSEGGRVTFGTAAFPVQELLFWGDLQAGAFCQENPVTLSQNTSLGMGSVYLRQALLKDDLLNYQDSVASAHGLFLLCRARVDGVVLKISSHQEWDLAPWVAIIESAGGRVSDEDGRPIVMKYRDPSYQYVVASNGAVHDELLQQIERSSAK